MKTSLNLGQLKTYIVPVLSLVVVIALIPLVIVPQLNQIASASKVIKQNEGRLDQIKLKDQTLKDLNNQKDTLDTQLRTVEAALPVDKAIAQLILGIQQVAGNNGLKVVALKMQPGRTATSSAKPSSPTAPSSQNAAPTVPTGQAGSTNDTLIFTISVQGSLDQLKSFLGTIERAKRVLLVKQFNSSRGSNVYDIQIAISTPFGPLPKLSPDQIAQTVPTLSVDNKRLLSDLQNTSTDFVTGEIGTVPTGVPNPFSLP